MRSALLPEKRIEICGHWYLQKVAAYYLNNEEDYQPFASNFVEGSTPLPRRKIEMCGHCYPGAVPEYWWLNREGSYQVIDSVIGLWGRINILDLEIVINIIIIIENLIPIRERGKIGIELR